MRTVESRRQRVKGAGVLQQPRAQKRGQGAKHPGLRHIVGNHKLEDRAGQHAEGGQNPLHCPGRGIAHRRLTIHQRTIARRRRRRLRLRRKRQALEGYLWLGWRSVACTLRVCFGWFFFFGDGSRPAAIALRNVSASTPVRRLTTARASPPSIRARDSSSLSASSFVPSRLGLGLKKPAAPCSR